MLTDPRLWSRCSPHLVISSLLDLLPVGIAIVTPQARIVGINQAAQDILAKSLGLQNIENTLVATSARDDSTLRELIHEVADGSQSMGAMRLAEGGEPPLTIAVAHPGSSRTSRAKVATAVVFLFDILGHKQVQDSMFARVFGFTPAECTVAKMVIQGKDVAEIASTLGISTHTVRNQLKRLFVKTGTNKQAELVCTLLTSPACLRLTDSDASSIAGGQASGISG